jgi:hypothetical protein
MAGREGDAPLEAVRRTLVLLPLNAYVVTAGPVIT